MNKYKIAKNVDVNNSGSAMGVQVLSKKLVEAGKMVPFVRGPIVAVATIKKYTIGDIKEISTLEELDTFSCVECEWDRNCVYVEHPIIHRRLIASRMYKDYLLKELMSEIFDYITDNIAVKRIVLGLESKGKIEAEATVPISDIVVDAKLKGSLNSNYLCSMEDVDCTNGSSEKEYPWMKYYPDIVSAVQKNTGKLEIKQCVKMDLDVGLGIQDVVKGAFKADKEYNFYVYYEKAESE